MVATLAATKAMNGAVVTVVELATGVYPAEAEALFRKAGAQLITNPDLLAKHWLVEADRQALENLSQEPQVVTMFAASADLASGVPVRGCGSEAETAHEAEGDPDNDPDNDTDDYEVDEYTDGFAGWYMGGKETELTWTVSRATQQVPREAVLGAIGRALEEWSRHAQLRFRYAAEVPAARNLNFVFASGEHGDPFAFDGPRGLLAHAFYPPPYNREPIAGDLHFDDDESWSDGGNPDLYSVILHELGHALGLNHSTQPASVMYPYYRLLKQLQTDDIRALQRIYPVRTAETPSEAAPLTISATVPAFTALETFDLAGSVAGGTGAVEVSWSTASAGGQAEGGRSWKATGIPLAAGLNTITLLATDEAGLKVTRAFTITRVVVAATPAPSEGPAPGVKDTIAPTLKVTSPSTTVYGTSAARLKISGTARDNIGVAAVTWQSTSASGSALGSTSWNFEVPLLVGDNNVTVRVRDEAGNMAWRNLLITRR